MRHAGLWVVSGASFSVIAQVVAAARPRGVGPDFAKFYQDAETFTCISDPSVKLPISQLNDDFCDCPDGSDEPGTSACSYLSPLSPSFPSDPTSKDTINATVALPGFYCKNKGHSPSYLPFSNVNDGVCDYHECCDGSDEWQGLGGIKCPDRCGPIGAEARKHAETRQAALTAAGKSRKALVLDAARLRKQLENELETIAIQISVSQVSLSAAEAELVTIESQERGRIVKSSKGSKLGVLTTLARERTNELRDSLLKIRRERDSSVDRVNELESILSTFKEDYNPNFNDEGVKRAVRAWEDYAARDKPALKDEHQEKDLDEIVKTDEENGVVWDDYNDEETSETDLLYNFEAYLPPRLRIWLDDALRSLRVTLIENGILASQATDEIESKAVTDARARVQSIKDELSRHQTDQQAKRDDLVKDYGSDDIFRALKGRCASKESGEYTYEICFMDHTAQKSRKGAGGGETRMGSFTGFGTLVVDDDDVPADGRGVGNGERLVMKFENGQSCWNGPHRSTTAVLACAEKDELWKIVEEEKCVYRMDVGTPAACDVVGKRSSTGEDSANDVLKDEL